MNRLFYLFLNLVSTLHDEDVCLVEDENVKLINFEDGTLLKYDKTEHKLSIEVEGDVNLVCKNADITADLITVNGKTIFNDEVVMLKTLAAVGTITSSVDCVSNCISGFEHTHPYTWTDPGGSGDTDVP